MCCYHTGLGLHVNRRNVSIVREAQFPRMCLRDPFTETPATWHFALEQIYGLGLPLGIGHHDARQSRSVVRDDVVRGPCCSPKSMFQSADTFWSVENREVLTVDGDAIQGGSSRTRL